MKLKFKNSVMICVCILFCLYIFMPNVAIAKSNASINKTKAAKQTSLIKPKSEKKTLRLQDDFYQAVNQDWLNKNKLPTDKTLIGGFNDIAYKIEDQLISDMNEMLLKKTDEKDNPMGHMLRFYRMALDYKKLDSEGAIPIQNSLNKIKSIKTLSDMNAQLETLTYIGAPLPFQISVTTDMKDTTQNALYATTPGLHLIDKSYYEDDHPMGKNLIPVYEQSIIELMQLAGESENNAKKIAKETIQFEKLLAPTTLSAEESMSFACYNPTSHEDFCGYTESLDFYDYMKKMLGTVPEQVIVMVPRYYENLDKILTEKNLSLIKSWMMTGLVKGAAPYLSENFRQTNAKLTLAMTGQSNLSKREKSSYRVATQAFSHVIGNYYGEKYFGPKARADVTTMVKNMITVYKDQLHKNDWLGNKTKIEAIKKLDTMAIQIGYPDEIPDYLNTFKVTSYEKGGTLFSNVMQFSVLAMKENYAQLNKPVNRNQWNMTADTVNAMYQPMSNMITFPAGILQAPFYDIHRSASENYGGIGAIIAHEISHAFDNTGAKYDELGNLTDWWTKEDYKTFEAKSKEMQEIFDKETYMGSPINGTLTLGENIADAGGLRCALEVAKKLPDSDLAAFFKSWANIWRMKSTPEYEKMALLLDPHVPNPLRTNVQVSLLDEFYQTFDVKKGDKMYRDPKDRVKIW